MLRRIKQELKDGKTLLQFGFLKGLGQALGMIAPLVVAKFFSPELFGSYSLAKMIMFFFSTLLIASSQTPFVVFANQEKAKTGKINKVFSVQCTFLTFSFAAFAIVSMLFGEYIRAFAKIDWWDLFFVILAFIGMALKTFLCNLFMAMGQRIKNALAELTFGFLSLFLVIVFYFLDWINLRSVFLIYLLAFIGLIIIFFKAINFDLLFPFGLEKEYFRKMFDFTKWVLLGTTAVYFINWGDNLVLRFYVSMEDIGTYNLAYQVFKSVLMLTFIIYAYFLPFVSEYIGDRIKIKSYLSNKRPRIFLLGLVAISVFFVVGPWMLGAIYGDKYTDLFVVLRVLLVGSVFMLYAIFYAPILNSLKKYKFAQTVNMIQVVLNIILNLLLVPRMGLLGAAIATSIAYFCHAAMMEIYFRIRLKKLLNL